MKRLIGFLFIFLIGITVVYSQGSAPTPMYWQKSGTTVIPRNALKIDADSIVVDSLGVTKIYISGDLITDFAGTGLSVTSGVLNASAGLWATKNTTDSVTYVGTDTLIIISSDAGNDTTYLRVPVGPLKINDALFVENAIVGNDAVHIMSDQSNVACYLYFYGVTEWLQWNETSQKFFLSDTLDIMGNLDVDDTIRATTIWLSGGTAITSLEGSNLSVTSGVLNATGTSEWTEVDDTDDSLLWIAPNGDTAFVIESDGAGNTIITVGKESDNSATTLRIKVDTIDISGDVIADFAGTGLSVSSGALVSDLGTAIDSAEFNKSEVIESTQDWNLGAADNGTQTRITVTYQDATDDIDFVVDDFGWTVDQDTTYTTNHVRITDSIRVDEMAEFVKDVYIGDNIETVDTIKGAVLSNTTVLQNYTAGNPITEGQVSWDGTADQLEIGKTGGTVTLKQKPDAATTADSALAMHDGGLDEADLKCVNSPTDEYVLTYESTTGDFEWEVDQTGTGAWTEVDDTKDTLLWIAPNADTAFVLESDGSGNTILTVGKESDNSATTLRIKVDTLDISGDVIADFAGNNLTVASGVLDVDVLDTTTTTISHTQWDEHIKDNVGDMVTGNTETGIAVTYQDADNTLDFVVTESDPTLTNDGAVTIGSGSNADVTLTFDGQVGTDGLLWWDESTDQFRADGGLSAEADLFVNVDSTATDACIFFYDSDEMQSFKWLAGTDKFEISDDLNVLENITLAATKTVDGVEISALNTAIAADSAMWSGLADVGDTASQSAAIAYRIESTTGESKLQIISSGNGAGDHAKINLGAGAANGNAYFTMTLAGQRDWSFGCDNADGDNFKLSLASVLGTNDIMEIGADSSFQLHGEMTIDSILIVTDSIRVDGTVDGVDIAALDADVAADSATWNAAADKFDTNYTQITLATVLGAVDLGGATSLEIPNGTDPDVDAAGEITQDTDGANETGDVSIRGYDGSNQFSVARKLKTIQATIIAPNDLDDTERDCVPIWHNGTGMVFTITEIWGWSDTDDTSVNVEVVTATNWTTRNTIDALEIATNGTGVFTVTETTISDATIAHDEIITLDFDDTDTPGVVKIAITGWFNADVD